MNIKYNPKKITRICTLILAIVSVVSPILCQGVVNANASNRLLPVYRVSTERRLVSLTFDAAWGSDKTSQILDILDLYGIKATFFLVGFWITANPELTQEISRRGHEIGTHSMTHPQMSKLSREKIIQELSPCCDMITELTGKKVTVFRPPFGDYDNELISTCDELGLQAIQWDIDSLDWKGLDVKSIAIRCQKAKPGSIILFHNNSDNIVKALPVVIESLINKGLGFVPVSELIYKDNFTINSQGEQICNLR